ncbi:MAG: NUDIX hydrolase [Solirubrobacterales bacterium]
MERVGGRLVYRGSIFAVREDMFRYEDGGTAERQLVLSPPASAVVAHDGETLFMVRQPREAVREDALLELPAGKVDENETPLEAAQRELAEEIGREAEDWRHLHSFYATPGFATEELHLFLATGLRRVGTNPDQGEKIKIVEVPLDQLQATIDDCHDAKSLVGLLLLREILRGG